ncbi:MAG: hypothetical protein NTW65_10890 [Deltaproteobacteria bacterium]|nr:hypothetical protein [Deltaproteobacteria bacterium]
MKNYLKISLAALSAFVLVGCSASLSKVIKEEPVKNIPDKKYETIIKLNIWESEPLRSEAGFVYVETKGRVTTDFPREEFVKNLDMVDKYKQLNRNNMSKFVIKDSKGKVRGYYEMLPEYKTIIWERGDDILLQVIIPHRGGNDDETGDRTSGGKHDGP